MTNSIYQWLWWKIFKKISMAMVEGYHFGVFAEDVRDIEMIFLGQFVKCSLVILQRTDKTIDKDSCM